ncbi:MAG: gluconate transporter [Bacteroidetes bacterium GWE2_41_25]|nr:MAG: gluconate transporter [Bacteroidetes bacterium GWA2_40_15]OFX93353.1 MAG: gluconate transporter [Bacteroidetes bacterium GWE2_41_25]OFX97806.1 MAG: gluconate transporter [Bacteroidetes bacterium GWC2_40_22]OFY60812.1 MAG: gluconate transporter [Bacteroidetes bacterium GWF2_41_9]HBH83764.1 gluconate transporter [Bacteroidales bacterium]
MTFIIIILAIALQVFLSVKKVNAFLSLLIVSILSGLFLGMQPAAIIKSVETGVGSTLAGLALIICLGAVLGKILESSGAAKKISLTLIKAFGIKNIQWSLLLTGFLVGIPLFYNAGFVILVPLVFSIAKETRLPLLYLAIPMAASLSTAHCFLPPHPGPVILVNAFKADMGKTLIYGFVLAIPAIVLAGPYFGRLLKNVKINLVGLFGEKEDFTPEELPAAFPSFLIAMLPVLLITLSVIANRALTDGSLLKNILVFAGDANVALLITVIIASWFFGLRAGHKMENVMKWLSDGISGIAIILLIITAGGVFKQVLSDSGAADYILSFSKDWQMQPFLFAWLVTACLRVTIGSATVAAITASGIVAPLVATTNVSPELMVLAVGSGSVFMSHVNDTAFWMFKEFFNLSLKQTFFSWTLMETSISFIGLIGVFILNSII